VTQTIERTNGHQPHTEDDQHPSHEDGQPSAEEKPGKEAKVQLLVERTTRQAVTAAAKRLGRSQDQIVAAGVALLNQKTKEQRAKTKQEWLNEITGGAA
jgi:hypothetical protein